jgi:dTDP-4-dehydrorhamnose reductase
MNILLTGGTGFLGSKIIDSNLFKNLYYPTREEMDLTDMDSIKRCLMTNNIDVVIHCAALARMSRCQNDPDHAITNNIIGTSNLVVQIIEESRRAKKNYRFIHISTDAVYTGDVGNYNENSKTIPYNNYGWSKLGAECAVRLLPDHAIVRTTFFDEDKIIFKTSATDIYTSSIPVTDLVRSLHELVYSGFIGTINIGLERMSDFDRKIKYKPSIMKTTRSVIEKEAGISLPQDSSMNCGLWGKTRKS